ncbi:cuticle protein CP14.6-like [Uranotaenia lowii]|uniref:cuticle protein CP14.6-like n=1 Tax=Uranotaenia lowii TaxID=190385 RepID=UPI00247B27FE|nr:cuticle protein CP14.6-like [Uranotaenia lowii]
MKFVIVLAIAVVAVSGQIRPGPGGPFPGPIRPAPYGGPEAGAVILNQVYEPNPDGSYIYSYETSNGIRAEQRGFLKNPGTPGEAQVMQGSYSYTGPDGVVYTINYIADENGYRAEGAHIPSAPRYNPRFPGQGPF